ncbi:MAG: alpha/beta fold hydrolase [Candidatus Pacearchaeota archaeon]
MIHPTAKTREFKSKSKKIIILFHGYTGSPTDFNGLGEYLHKKYKVNVLIPLLKGHGKTLDELISVKYDDFISQSEKIIKRKLKEGKEIILGGYSLGGYLATEMAAKYPVKCVFTISTPYKLRFPFNFKPIKILKFFKKKWKKAIRQEKYEFLINNKCFVYRYLPSSGIDILYRGVRSTRKLSKKINVPMLLISPVKDIFGKVEGMYKFTSKTPTPRIHERVIIYNSNYHDILFSPHKEKIFLEISKFLEKQGLVQR